MKRYCFDTSGFSNPHENMPEDNPIFRPLWSSLIEFVEAGHVATTREIYDEMCHITGDFRQCINAHKPIIVLEVGDDGWDFLTYIAHNNRMQKVYHQYISEYGQRSSRKTISLTDMTTIALAKTLRLPVVSMETSTAGSMMSRRIPDICQAESVLHYTFNDFLRIESLG